MDSGIRRARVVEVVCTRSTTGYEAGSGYVLGDRLVLTAYHVVEGARSIEVGRLPEFGGTTRLRAELIWPQTPPDHRGNPGTDVALLRVVDPAWQAPYAPLVVVGSVGATERIEAEALGFPHVAMRPGEKRLDTVCATGEVDPHFRLKAGLTAFFVKEPILLPGSDPAAWKGFSGAAVFSDGCLVGVAVRHRTNPRDTLLECAPLAGLPALVELLDRVGAINQGLAEVKGPHSDGAADRGVYPVQVGYSPGRLTRFLRATALLLALAVLAATVVAAARYAGRPEPLPLLRLISLTALAGLFGVVTRRLSRFPRSGYWALRDAQLNLAKAVRTTAARRRAELLGARQRLIDLSFGTDTLGSPAVFRPAAGNRVSRIGEWFDAMPRPQRLVITGGPGSGKTLLANELVRRILGRPGADGIGSVPVLLGLADWDPIGTDFITWVTTKLAREYGSGQERLFYLLLADGRITPVLDGLDEMDPPGSGHPRADRALEQLNRLAESAEDSFPLVLTCRDTEEYADLLHGRERLHLGVTARIDRVPPTDVLARLSDEDAGIDESGWLWRELTAEGSAAREVLSSPWMLALATAIRLPSGGEDELRRIVTADASGAGRESRLRSALLRGFIPSVCRTHPRGGTSYRPEAVSGWLRQLTSHPHGEPNRARDIAVQSLWPIAGARGRRVAGVLSVLCWLPILVLCALTLWWNGRPVLAVTIPTALSLGPVISARTAASPRLRPRRIKLWDLWDRSSPAWPRIGVGLLIGGLCVFPLALVTSPGFALAFGSAFAAVHGFGFGLAVRRSIDATRMVLTGVPPALAVVGLPVALATWRYGGVAGFITGCGTGAVALALGVPPGVRAAQRAGFGQQRANPPGVPTPLSLLRHDAMAGLAAGLITAGLCLYGTSRLPFLRVSWPWAVAIAVAAALAAGLGFVADVTRQYLGVRLAMRGRLPWRLIAFLRWGQRSGLLRSAGAAYQLRHEELLDWLHGPDSGLGGIPAAPPGEVPSAL